MKAKYFLAITILQLIVFIFGVMSDLHASGVEPLDRRTILRIADEMIDFSWAPRNNFSNYATPNQRRPYVTGKLYRGIAYSKQDDQEDWVTFYWNVINTGGGYVSYGNDCSGFVGISWQLPERYNTLAFECDAIDSPVTCNLYNPGDDYVHKLGEKGDADDFMRVKLKLGDALVSDTGEHIILFERYNSDKSGIWSMEQSMSVKTHKLAGRKEWSWNSLESYRPIRRNNINEGNYELAWFSNGSTNALFNSPNGIAVDSTGNVFVADSAHSNIQKFDSNGNFIDKWGGPADTWPDCSQNKFRSLFDISIDQAGNIYAIDSNCDNFVTYIHKFSGDGSFLSWLNISNGWQYDPNSISIGPEGKIYLVDSIAVTQARIYSSNGTLLHQWGEDGTNNGQFNFPRGIAVDSTGNIYVADTYNHRIQKFDNTGQFLDKWTGSGENQFLYPRDIAFDSSSNIYVVDSGNLNIQKLDSNGNFITKWGSFGTGDDQFYALNSIAVDLSLNVYVTDSSKDRLYKFTPVSPIPSGPSNLDALVSPNRVDLYWQDQSNNESNFVVMKKVGIDGVYGEGWLISPNTTSFSDYNVAAGQEYYYAVYAVNEYGESEYSNESEGICTSSCVSLPIELTSSILNSISNIILLNE